MSDLNKLREANRARQKEWGGYENADELFRAIELGEEAGEVLGAVKKLTRERRGIVGNRPGVDRMQNLREEMGDVLICLDLLADAFDINLLDCVTDKFNKTSTKNGIPVFVDRELNVVPADAGQAELFDA
ncbi:nucleotide pyrophosphohydrolase [Ruegeria phage RpAliso]|nr:nucleotide pyrophosphohydrolase [Ruegeria phage RpAliso]